jgi:extracellular elastinolytic metalloproteinase
MATKSSKSKSAKKAKKASSSGTARKAASAKARKSSATQSEAVAVELPSRTGTALPNRSRSAVPAFHVPEDFHALYDRGFRAARGITAPAGDPPETSGQKKLAAKVPGLEVEYDQATHLPNRIVSLEPAARLSMRAAASPEEAVKDFVQKRGDLWNLSKQDAATVEVTSVSKKGLQTVNLIQRVEGKEVFNSDMTAAVGPSNEVISMAGQFFPGAGARHASTRAVAERRTSEEEAIAKAATDLTSIPYEASDFAPSAQAGNNGPYRFYEFKAQKKDKRPPFDRPVRLKDVMFPLGESQFVPGYYMELWIRTFPAFSYVIDAIDEPDVLYRRNLTHAIAFSYRVHNTGDAISRPEDGPAPGSPHPTGVPNGFQAPTVKEKLIAIESLLHGDPWLADTAKTTKGNNCFAYADIKKPDGFSAGDVVGKVTAPKTFDYKYDHTKSARDANNLQNSIVGMFFHVNWLHDRWYEAGFDEASGNGQANNFGRGGVGGDPVLAEGLDFSGTDNANMSTPADGASPQMQMYEFVGVSPKPSRTSNHEALITFHEMGHYITNRLVGNASGLTNTQGGAMGEGWGDFFAICMTSQSTDNFASGCFAVGGWTDLTPTFKENYYFSIRRYPYTADMGKNPLTFKHISNSVVLPTGPPRHPGGSGPNNEIHNAGEIWCCALWEVFVNLVAKHGHADAEKRMLSYVIGGLKVTPLRPTYTQARDAIITAVSSLDPGDLTEVKKGFAKRGMGKGAVSPPSSSSSLSGVVESFTP